MLSCLGSAQPQPQRRGCVPASPGCAAGASLLPQPARGSAALAAAPHSDGGSQPQITQGGVCEGPSRPAQL